MRKRYYENDVQRRGGGELGRRPMARPTCNFHDLLNMTNNYHSIFLVTRAHTYTLAPEEEEENSSYAAVMAPSPFLVFFVMVDTIIVD